MATRSESAEQDPTPEETVRLEVEGHTGGGPGVPDLAFIRGLIDAVDGSGIDALEITRAGTRIKISKTPPGSPAPAFYGAAPPAAPAAPAPAAPAQAPGPGPSNPGASATETAPAGAPSAESESGSESAEESGLVEITSPMVGTFYRAPAPDAPPYVEPGTRVRKGQTLCILEAMKLMNELESEADGVIREVLVENAEPVEYGQVLFLVEPD